MGSRHSRPAADARSSAASPVETTTMLNLGRDGDPRSPTAGLRRSTTFDATGKPIIQDDGVIDFEHAVRRGSAAVWDPRSPTVGIARTPIPESPTRVAGQSTWDPRSPTVGIARTPIPIKGSATPPRIESGQSMWDPRSPTIGIARTPIPIRASANSQRVDSGQSIWDPRSPTLGIARTPIPDSPTQVASQSVWDPRSPTVGIARTPVPSNPAVLSAFGSRPVGSMASTRVVHAAGGPPLVADTATITNAPPPPVWSNAGSMASIEENPSSQSAVTHRRSSIPLGSMSPTTPKRRTSLSITSSPQIDPRSPKTSFSFAAQPITDPREPTHGLHRTSLVMPAEMQQSEHPKKIDEEHIDDDEYNGEGYLEISDPDSDLQQDGVDVPPSLVETVQVAAQIIQEFSLQSAEILNDESQNVSPGADRLFQPMKPKTFSPTTKQARRESLEVARRESTGGSPRRKSDVGVGNSSQRRKSYGGVQESPRKVFGIINSPGSSAHNSQSSSRRGSEATVFFPGRNNSLPNIPLPGTTAQFGSPKKLFDTGQLSGPSLRI